MKKTRTVKISKYFLLVVVFLFGLIILKLSYIVLSPKVDGISLSEFASNRNTVKETIVAPRGTIYDSLGNTLAVNVNSYTVIAYLSESREDDRVKDKEGTAKALSPLINMTEESILSLLNIEGVYQVELGPGGRGITELVKENIEKLNLPGIDFIKSVKRYYPNRNFLSYTLGYAKTNDDGEIVGEMGLERQYNKDLTGINGSRTYESDIYGYKIANTNEEVIEAKNGKDIYLTIDTNIQMFTEQAMKTLETASSMEWASISVVNAKTGEILGISSNPSFDPNVKNITSYYDPFISYTYEPGSTMKTFSFMAAIENGLYDGEEKYNSGSIKVGEYTIKDWNKTGWGSISFNEGFYGSSNVAATLLSQRLGRDKLKDFYRSLGFGKKTGIDLPNEQSGKIDFNYDIEVANASFGQGMSITAIQMVQAMTSISNDGEVIKPYIVKKIVDSNTKEVLVENKRTVVKRVASKETVNQVRDLLDGVVNNLQSITASGHRYRSDKVRTIGKTGTAEIAGDGGYLTGSINYVRSFAGMFPYEDPQIIVYVVASKISDNLLIAKATKQLVEDTSTYLGIVSSEVSPMGENYTLKSYVNRDVVSSIEELESIDSNVILIGDGTKVISQYPKKGTIINSNDKVFLVTNGTNYKYTNIEGFSRSDLDVYSKLLGVNFNYNGYGYAFGTNLKGRNVVKGETIDINLKVKYLEVEDNSTNSDL